MALARPKPSQHKFAIHEYLSWLKSLHFTLAKSQVTSEPRQQPSQHTHTHTQDAKRKTKQKHIRHTKWKKKWFGWRNIDRSCCQTFLWRFVVREIISIIILWMLLNVSIVDCVCFDWICGFCFVFEISVSTPHMGTWANKGKIKWNERGGFHRFEIVMEYRLKNRT